MNAIKICGLTRANDARTAVDLGADLLGLVFHRPSPRSISPTEAIRLTKTVTASWVGVFVDTPIDRILRIADTAGLYGVQLHGAEPGDSVSRLRRAGLFVIRAHRIARAEDLPPADSEADADLLDAFDPTQPGGTGKAFDWRLAIDMTHERRILLAGGLDARNVAAAIGTVRPWGVDVSTGVESSPGHKDPEKMARFVASARAAFAGAGGFDGKH